MAAVVAESAVVEEVEGMRTLGSSYWALSVYMDVSQFMNAIPWVLQSKHMQYEHISK